MNDGGPAFPPKTPIFIYYPQDAGKQLEEELKRVEDLNTGMTLRDWFAGQALAMLGDPKVANLSCCEEENHSIDRRLAEACYGIADAMLKARGKS